MTIRRYKSADCRSLALLFYQTVHTVNGADYTAEQLDAWANGEVDTEAWDRSFRAHYTVVAENDGVLTGFGDIDRNGYLDRLYVHKDHQREGIATAICDELEKQVMGGRIVTEASITARPFFENRGYTVVCRQQVLRRDVLLTNYLMEKQVK